MRRSSSAFRPGAAPPPLRPHGARTIPGVYVLIVSLKEGQTIRVGRLCLHPFAPGLYLYVGSALGGLEARIKRHLALDKRRHWHIDYLLDAGQVKAVIAIPTTEKIECQVASSLAHHFEGVDGFGCSDCKCRSHLFYAPKGDYNFIIHQMEDIIKGEITGGVVTWKISIKKPRGLPRA